MPPDGVDVLTVRVEGPGDAPARDHAFDRSPVRVGRSFRNDLHVDHPFASGEHGIIEFDAQGVRYTDLGSANGSVVDGKPAPPREAVAVPPGATVVVGNVRLVVSLRPAAGRPDGGVAEPVDGTRSPAESGAQPPPGRITGILKQVIVRDPDEAEGAWKSVLYPGAVIGRFELVRELGRGGFGVVYEARDRQLGRLVAFKAVRPGRHSQVVFRKQALQLEAEAVASLTHPNIVHLYDVGACDAGPYLIFERLRGETLAERVRREPMTVAGAVDVSIQVARALEHAHNEGVVHRDLKPSNVFLCKDDLVKVLDFGLADVFGGGDLRRVGTPAYMAPEQWKGERQDARTDIYAASVMLCEAATGKLPFRVSIEGSAALEPGAQATVEEGGLPPSLVALIARGVDPDPARRPPDGKSWLGALLAVQRDLG